MSMESLCVMFSKEVDRKGRKKLLLRIYKDETL